MEGAYGQTPCMLWATGVEDSGAQFFGGITRERDSAKTADFMLIDQVLCARREHPCFTGAGACKNGNVPRRCDSSRLKRIEFQSAIVLSGFSQIFSGALLSFIFGSGSFRF